MWYCLLHLAINIVTYWDDIVSVIARRGTGGYEGITLIWWMQYVMSWQREDAGDSDDNTDNFSQSFRKTAAILYYGTVETIAVNKKLVIKSQNVDPWQEKNWTQSNDEWFQKSRVTTMKQFYTTNGFVMNI